MFSIRPSYGSTDPGKWVILPSLVETAPGASCDEEQARKLDKKIQEKSVDFEDFKNQQLDQIRENGQTIKALLGHDSGRWKSIKRQ